MRRVSIALIALCVLPAGGCAATGALEAIERIKVADDGCQKDIEAAITLSPPMPPSGFVRITKRCEGAKSDDADH